MEAGRGRSRSAPPEVNSGNRCPLDLGPAIFSALATGFEEDGVRGGQEAELGAQVSCTCPPLRGLGEDTGGGAQAGPRPGAGDPCVRPRRGHPPPLRPQREKVGGGSCGSVFSSF